jgi:DnaJ family protein C protein 17
LDAAAEFQKLQRAYDILNDEKARASYDELQRVRKERVQKESRQSEKRQKMMRDLAEKEKVYEREQKAKSQEGDVQRRLKAEIARITKARGRQYKGPSSFDQGESANGDARKPFQGPSSFDQGKFASVDARQQFYEPPPFDLGKPTRVEVPPQSSSVKASDAERTLKVSWTCLESGAGDYSASRLKEVFEAFGIVEDLVVRSGKSRKKRSALIVMATKQAAVTATETVCGDHWNPLLVVPLLPGTSGLA